MLIEIVEKEGDLCVCSKKICILILNMVTIGNQINLKMLIILTTYKNDIKVQYFYNISL